MKNKLVVGTGALALLAIVAVVVNWVPEGDSARVAESSRTESSTSYSSPVAPPKVAATGVAERSKPTAAVLPSTSDSSPIPDVADPKPVATEVDLWQLDESEPDTLFDGNPAKRLHADPNAVATLQVGQKLHLKIPQRDIAVEAEIASTQNLTPRTQMWQGKIFNGHPQDNVVVTRGQIETHVTISTYDGTYLAVIDNATGDTVMVDEGDINANQVPHEDGIAIDPVVHRPPSVGH